MSTQNTDGHIAGILPITQQSQSQDEETSDCPLLTPSPPPDDIKDRKVSLKFQNFDNVPLDINDPIKKLKNFDNEFRNIIRNSSSKELSDEPTSRDPMVETSSSSGSDTNEPVCTQLLTQLNTAYTHLAPDAQALFYNQETGGAPLVGIQLVVPKPQDNYDFMNWNWPVIRKVCFWSLMSFLIACTALVIGVIATLPKKCEPTVEWWQGSLFYEIFPGSFKDSQNNDAIGDLNGITQKLDYLNELGVKVIRLNSIFSTNNYPNNYQDIKSLIDIDKKLGTIDDFDNLVSNIHMKNMKIILDLPLHPFIKNLDGAIVYNNNNNNISDYYDDNDDNVILPEIPPLETVNKLTDNLNIDSKIESDDLKIKINQIDNNLITESIKYWLLKNVDGFYLKNLNNFVNEPNFPNALKYWKKLLGSKKILICNYDTLIDAPIGAPKNVILNRIDLVDINLDVTKDTKNIGQQINDVFKGKLFEKPNYPWVHWSFGNLLTSRLSSRLKIFNASIAIEVMEMILPGTPSIFYGDEIGLRNSESTNHNESNNLVPIIWDKSVENSTKYSSIPWILNSSNSLPTNSLEIIADMSKLRSETAAIYVNSVIKNNEGRVNCNIRYTSDEIIVIERWYPRRNTIAFLANLGNKIQTKDLSSIYYAGHVIVGPKHKLNEDIYFKELIIYPGEAFVIKLDK